MERRDQQAAHAEEHHGVAARFQAPCSPRLAVWLPTSSPGQSRTSGQRRSARGGTQTCTLPCPSARHHVVLYGCGRVWWLEIQDMCGSTGRGVHKSKNACCFSRGSVHSRGGGGARVSSDAGAGGSLMTAQCQQHVHRTSTTQRLPSGQVMLSQAAGVLPSLRTQVARPRSRSQ